jgi:hypothetical protein
MYCRGSEIFLTTPLNIVSEIGDIIELASGKRSIRKPLFDVNEDFWRNKRLANMR